MQAEAQTAADRWPIVLGFFAAGNLVNAVWMLASPAHWYLNLPANIPGTGPLNEHFVRDIGCIFLLLGVALLAGMFVRRLRLPAMVLATAYSLLHALVHVYDSARGLLAPDHWRVDVVPIYATTLLSLWLTVKLAREERARSDVSVAR
jgi:hypothetical protein